MQIHRDLKPENVLLMKDARLKLADFGLCKQLNDASQLAHTFCGTSEYIAPEIYRRSNYSFPVDFWSLGIMIYEMQTLKTPFYHEFDQNIEYNVVHNEFHRPDYFPADMESLVAGLLTKNPNDRFGADKLRSHPFFTSPYSLDEIEQSKARCPWRRTVSSSSFQNTESFIQLYSIRQIPTYPPAEECLAEQPVHLSHIDAQAMCTTLTANKDVFRNFSFTFADRPTT
jgi:serine/threonine protein kinase